MAPVHERHQDCAIGAVLGHIAEGRIEEGLELRLRHLSRGRGELGVLDPPQPPMSLTPKIIRRIHDHLFGGLSIVTRGIKSIPA